MEVVAETVDDDDEFDNVGVHALLINHAPPADDDAPPPILSESQKRRATAKIRVGEISKAKEILTAPATFSAASMDTFRKLLQKHPLRLPQNEIDLSPESPFVPNRSDIIKLTREQVWLAIRSAARGSASGLDGLRFDHLYHLSFGGSHIFMDPLTAFCNLAVQGSLPQWYYTFTAGANLIALDKAGGGVRPIAMGSVWRKLVSKAVLYFLDPQIVQHFSHFQYGVGSRAGCEIVYHRTRQLLATPGRRVVVIKTDFSNAFNSILRRAILNAVKISFPGLYAYVLAVYGPKSELWTAVEAGRRSPILSEEGVQQGDVLGPFLFCLVLQPILIELNEILKQRGFGEVLGLMDDLSVICDQDDAADVLSVLMDRAASVGLSLSLNKCGVFSPAGAQDIDPALVPPEIQRHDQGLELLGLPLGSDAFCDSYWTNYLNQTAEEMAIVTSWDNVQSALLLFRMCIASKLNYMLRSLLPPLMHSTGK